MLGGRFGYAGADPATLALLGLGGLALLGLRRTGGDQAVPLVSGSSLGAAIY